MRDEGLDIVLRGAHLTGGIFDALDVATGKYVKSVDMGIQDFIERIDPETGDKFPKAEKLPGRDKGAVFVCPHGGGGRNWSPTPFGEWRPAGLAAADGLLYVVGTAPGAAADTQTLEVRISRDGGASFESIQLPVSVPAGTYFLPELIAAEPAGRRDDGGYQGRRAAQAVSARSRSAVASSSPASGSGPSGGQPRDGPRARRQYS